MTVPLRRIHRSIGMGERLVPALLGETTDAEHGDDVRDAEAILYRELICEVVPFPSARRLIQDLRGRGLAVVLASSACSREGSRRRSAEGRARRRSSTRSRLSLEGLDDPAVGALVRG